VHAEREFADDVGRPRRAVAPDAAFYGIFAILHPSSMLKHYLRIAWRNMRHHSLYTIIHILGLSLGICACIVIFLIARYDLGFDRFHPDNDRIYRIVGDVQNSGGGTIFLNCPPELAGLEHGIPGFEQKAIFHTIGQTVTIPAGGGRQEQEFGAGSERGYGTSVILTEPSFFSLFPHRWLLGNPAVLSVPNQIVLAESAARKYFGGGPLDSIMGRMLILDDSLPLTVGGIVKDWNKLSDLDYTGFVSISTAPDSWLKSRFATADWGSLHPHQSQAFVKLAKGVSAEQVNVTLADFIRKTGAHFFPGSSNMHLYLQPLSSIHFTPDFHPSDSGDDFRKAYLPLLYALIGVAIFILLLAVVNFINLSTAQSMQRLKEVGIRKVMGSSRKGLILQFLTETLLLTVSAVILSVLLVRPALWLFDNYIPRGVTFHFLDGSNGLFLLGITLLTCLLAGFYPARLMSSYLPVVSLKGALDKVGTGGGRLRKALIVFQFSISLVFIIGSIVITRQIRYMQTANKGFDSDAIMVENNWRAADGQLALFAQRVRQLAGVKQVILQGNAPMGWAHAGGSLVYKGKEIKNMTVMLQAGGADFIPFYGMRLLAGRNMLDGDSVREGVINETYARALGFDQPADAVGKLLYRDSVTYTIAGVVADFRQGSFHEAIQPEIIRREPRIERSVAIKLATGGKQGGETSALIAAMEKEWKKIFPKTPFGFNFLDDSIQYLYGQEANTAWLMQVATVITILISCMGLFGLALFTASRRAKEVGIRKVLGATVSNVALLLSRDFLLLVLLAFVVASPVAWYFADAWLSDFADHTMMNGWVLAEAGAAAIGLTLLTVGFQAVRAATANPVETLRGE